eukprot:scaffold122_cov236-Pinguiococcus_pyrenoidosus.AAC.15
MENGWMKAPVPLYTPPARPNSRASVNRHGLDHGAAGVQTPLGAARWIPLGGPSTSGCDCSAGRCPASALCGRLLFFALVLVLLGAALDVIKHLSLVLHERLQRVVIGLGILIKVGRVPIPSTLGHKGRLDFLVQQRRPVHGFKPLVLLDPAGAAPHAAQASGDVMLQQAPHQVLAVPVEVPRERHSVVQDLLVDGEGVLVEIRRVARQHLEDENAQGPPVHAEAVALTLNDLRRQVLRRAAERPRLVLHHLGEAEVGDLEEALARQQQVLRLEVSVDDAVVVQVAEGQHDGRGVELGQPGRKAALSA